MKDKCIKHLMLVLILDMLIILFNIFTLVYKRWFVIIRLTCLLRYKTFSAKSKFHKFCFMIKYGNIFMLEIELKQFNQIFVVSIHFIQRNCIYRFFNSQYSYRQCFKQFRSFVIMLSVKIKLSYWALRITYMIIYSLLASNQG